MLSDDIVHGVMITICSNDFGFWYVKMLIISNTFSQLSTVIEYHSPTFCFYKSLHMFIFSNHHSYNTLGKSQCHIPGELF